MDDKEMGMKKTMDGFRCNKALAIFYCQIIEKKYT